MDAHSVVERVEGATLHAELLKEAVFTYTVYCGCGATLSNSSSRGPKQMHREFRTAPSSADTGTVLWSSIDGQM